MASATRTGGANSGYTRLRTAKVTCRTPTLGWRLLRVLVASSRDHAFLDRAWIPWLFKLTPARRRVPLALHLLSLSPHYWVYQWSNDYPPELSRGDVLRLEYERNAVSRREICEKLLKHYLRPDQTVLDFGCGPGFLARAVSGSVTRVIAADVSRGVIACARELNPAPNLEYVANGVHDLAVVKGASIDLVYSFAVFQHLLREQTSVFFREFHRVLRPGGRGLFHTILRRPDGPGLREEAGWVARRVNVRMVYLSAAEIEGLLAEAGFTGVEIRPISALADIDDDLGAEHLVTFTR